MPFTPLYIKNNYIYFMFLIKVTAKFHSEKSTSILKDWLQQNSHHPYASKDTKQELARKCDLTELQVSNWLLNSRKKLKMRKL
jgi:hypothetical protein